MSLAAAKASLIGVSVWVALSALTVDFGIGPCALIAVAIRLAVAADAMYHSILHTIIEPSEGLQLLLQGALLLPGLLMRACSAVKEGLISLFALS